MTERFIKFIPSQAAIQLAINYKNAFVLLMLIAERARRKNGDPDGLKIGQCHLGSPKSFGMTDKEYRYAKKILVQQGLIKIVVTSRTRKKLAKTKKLFDMENGANLGRKEGEFGANESRIWGECEADLGRMKVEFGANERANEITSTGTLVELCNSEVWDINSEDSNQQKGEWKGECEADLGRMKVEFGANEMRIWGDKQERYKKEKNKEEEGINIAQTAARLRSKDSLSFDFQKWIFTGIEESELASWKLMYQHIDISVELLKAAQWLKSNPSKSHKKQWRKYLTGWFSRANDTIENKKAFRSATSVPLSDRKTKNMDGTPIKSRAEELF